MTRLIVPLTAIIVMIILFTTSTILVDAFTLTAVPSSTRRTTMNSKSKLITTTSLFAARKSSRSPLLEEALEAYPYSFDGKRAMVTKQKATVAFNELARLYGDEDALAMVKLESRVLVFNSDNYAPCLEAWTEQFGLEAAQGMVGRNPNLLAVRPVLAQKPAEDSMFFSYIIAAARPLPKIIGAGLLLSIATSGLH